jgi:hypothetical protein
MSRESTLNIKQKIGIRIWLHGNNEINNKH